MAPHPVRLVLDDDLGRSRLTVFFRLVLGLPHLAWALLWSFLVSATVPFAWLLVLITGRAWPELYAVNVRYLRWYIHFTAYLLLLANPYPRFDGRPGYPIDLEMARPGPQRRLITLFRLVLALPALVFASVLGTVLEVVALLGWFVCVVLGRMPRGMQDLGAYCLDYTVQTLAYVMLLTERYPSITFEPVRNPLPEADPPPAAAPELTPS